MPSYDDSLEAASLTLQSPESVADALAVSSWYVKVNNPPYLTAIDLAAEIDDTAVKVSHDKSTRNLVIEAKKVHEGAWKELVTKDDKQTVATRRAASIAAKEGKDAKVRCCLVARSRESLHKR